MAKALTAVTLQNLRPSQARRELPDGLVRGLYFVLQPSGKASWAVRYRHQHKTRKLTLGTFPAIDLKSARDLASKALVKVAAGVDPAFEKKTEAAARKNDAIEAVVDQFVERYAKANARRSWPETERILNREIVSAWRGRSLSTVTRREVHDLLDAIVDRGSPITANRTLAAFRRLCGWAVDRDLIARSPCVGLRPPSTEHSRDRILTDVELRRVWEACGIIDWPFGPLVRLLILTGQRRDEVGALRWSEIDLDAKVWTLPKERAKNNVEHVVPLTERSIEILISLPRVEPPMGKPDHVFTTGGGRPVQGYSKAKHRLDAATSIGGETIAHWTLHYLRRTFASGCARLGVQLPVIEKVLNHVSGSFGGIVGVYQRHSFAEEKRAALNLWADHVHGLVRSQ